MTRKRILLPVLLLLSGAVLNPSEGAAQDCVKGFALVRQAVQQKKGGAEESALYEDALKLCPKLPEAHHNLAVIALEEERYEEALKEIDRALEIKDDPQYHFTRGSILAGQKIFDKAQEEFERTLAGSTDKVKALQALASIYDRQGNLEKAEEKLLLAYQEDPTDTFTLFNLGVISEKIHKEKKALEYFDLLLKREPHHEEAMHRLVALCWSMRDVACVVKPLQQLEEEKKLSDEELRLLVVLYEQQNNRREAEETLRRVLAVTPDRISAKVLLAQLLTAEKRAEEALSLVLNTEEYAENIPWGVEALLVRADLFAQQKKFDEALVSLNQALKKDSSRRELHELRLTVLYALGKNDEARAEEETLKAFDAKNK